MIMKWFFDSGFDYINEFFENWNRKIKKMRNTCILVAVLLIVAGILCIAFPVEVFAVIQYVAAAALIIIGIYHIVSYVSTTYYFKDPMLIVMAVVNILMGVLVAAMPLILTVNVLTFMLAVLLIFSGAQKVSFASRLKYFGVQNTGMITVSGVLNIILSVIFILLPFASAVVLNYIIAAYLIMTGIALCIEAAGMCRIHR